jgi:pyridinium-3,5-biscarboxylic acid mononucleotide sulfurtransferase
MEPALLRKRKHLEEILHECGSLVIGYSGGVDSVLLAKLAADVLGRDRVLAVTGKSASLASWMESTAREVAERYSIPWLEVATEEGSDPRYVANPADRCYFCKSELWNRLLAVAEEHGFGTVADGSNADDVSDHRPGARAGAERSVRSPLLEAGIGKADIRALSRQEGLPTWDQPAAPCLASRIPYGIAVTPTRLRQVERAELALRRMGFRELRVRHHDGVARLEVHPSEIPALLQRRGEIVRELSEAGFDRVLLDLEGYRRGSLNAALGSGNLVRLGGGA